MGKKKDKTFSYNNTHGHGVYPPMYPAGQRYPHTDFHHNDPFWIYEELGILKDWLISLTKLGGMIAQMETDDLSEIIGEVKDLIDKLIDMVDKLYNSIYAVYQSETKFDSSLLSALELINGLNEYISNFINVCNPLFKELFMCIENRLTKDDTSINYINNEITEIFNYLNNQLVDNYVTLKEGVDYDVIFFNGFRYSNEEFGATQTVSIQLTTTEILNKKYYSIHIVCGHNTTSDHAITNDYIYTSNSPNESCPLFRHGEAWRDLPTSWIFMIKFKGDYDFLNYLTNSSYEQGSSNAVWNMYPRTARPSWAVNIAGTIANVYSSDNTINEGYGLILSLLTIADGINMQYYNYITYGFSDTIYFGNNLNIDLIINAHE